ncbi:MAG TPA: APC family permease [Edaphobacter sp.]|uniref:APC family permease n=1 Tax=Edaphobacter sp. TaxID=1934404 RepID=UPI002C099F38|nr:APC family permease [Edaphobacter sp.]HUZ95747.1 APC family permease [Edaphobacter sp.]
MMRFAFKTAKRKMLILPLIAATYFMVSGGPYGIEDILGGAGFAMAILILVTLPFLWSLPTALMIGELASALPAEGGFYVWVRRAMGPFWGYQEGWLSLSASIFDMAIYPAIFVLYLGKFSPALTAGWKGYGWSLAVVVLCCLWNLLGAPEVGEDSMWLFALLLAPFAIFMVLGLWRAYALHPAIHWGSPVSGSVSGSASASAFSTAILVAMWNYMGWDNASTVAQEVENPQRNYPRAMIASIILVAVTYILPLAAMAVAGLSPDSFSTGDWTTAARALGGPALGLAVVAGGAIAGIGIFNALVMSYSRLPMAMAEDGMMPRVLARRNSRGVPWVSVLVCGLAWALALNLPFERLISIDLILYGSSLLLEFVALAVLRIREPNLERPFKAGSTTVACLLGVGPAVLIGYALYAARDEKLTGSTSALLFSVAVGLLGPVLYWLTAVPLARRRMASMPASD